MARGLFYPFVPALEFCDAALTNCFCLVILVCASFDHWATCCTVDRPKPLLSTVDTDDIHKHPDAVQPCSSLGFQDLRVCIKQSYNDTACLVLERDGVTYGEAGDSSTAKCHDGWITGSGMV